MKNTTTQPFSQTPCPRILQAQKYDKLQFFLGDAI
jgi:hypothetical protein